MIRRAPLLALIAVAGCADLELGDTELTSVCVAAPVNFDGGGTASASLSLAELGADALDDDADLRLATLSLGEVDDTELPAIEALVVRLASSGRPDLVLVDQLTAPASPLRIDARGGDNLVPYLDQSPVSFTLAVELADAPASVPWPAALETCFDVRGVSVTP